MILWGMGISQHVHGTDNARRLIALSMMTARSAVRDRLHRCAARTTCRVRPTSA
jgi:hypothetical protein